jgi:hypothetical protein
VFTPDDGAGSPSSPASTGCWCVRRGIRAHGVRRHPRAHRFAARNV